LGGGETLSHHNLKGWTECISSNAYPNVLSKGALTHPKCFFCNPVQSFRLWSYWSFFVTPNRFASLGVIHIQSFRLPGCPLCSSTGNL